jgi:hypothetical protein
VAPRPEVDLCELRRARRLRGKIDEFTPILETRLEVHHAHSRRSGWLRDRPSRDGS